MPNQQPYRHDSKENNNSVMRVSIFIILTTMALSCHSNPEPISVSANEKPKVAEVRSDSIVGSEITTNSFETYKVDSLGWGYKIFQNGNMIINQPHIPSIQGNKGFTSQFKAATAAQFIITKLNKNIFPPSITPTELDSLGLLN